jgi:hypothetical protein
MISNELYCAMIWISTRSLRRVPSLALKTSERVSLFLNLSTLVAASSAKSARLLYHSMWQTVPRYTTFAHIITRNGP